MPEFSGTIISLLKRAKASEPGGLLSGKDPTAVDPSDPFRLWIIQIGLIIFTASSLAAVLKKVRQPKVIAEVLGGILLGPTAFGRIPGFTKHIFPEDSRPFLNLTANIGLCLFLFLVGMEIDAGVIKRNAKLSVAVAVAGMALPFGLGTALSGPLFHHFIDSDVQYTHFMLFTGVAYSITAFPVLCRILTELKLLDTTVGIVVLSAGVGNDIVGWTLLALSIALVNAGSGLMALYILLTCVGWTIFLLVPVKTAFRWLAKKTGSIDNGPTVFFMTVTMMTMLVSAFFTDMIGVHAIFGAFITGLIVPREGGLTIALTEKLEDMVAIIFLPLYFTLSGLSTDLGLLNSGLIWGFTIAIMSLAFTGKFGGCTLAAHYIARFNWRESATIGSLMSCKGLVELIVLNVGLSAGILNQRVFSMFVLEALVLTCMTTPLVTTLYPPKYRVRISKTGANFNNVADDEAGTNAQAPKKRGRGRRLQNNSQSHDHDDSAEAYEEQEEKTKFTVVLDRIEHLPGAMAIAQLINPLIYGFDDEVNQNHTPDPDEKNSFKEKISEKLQLKLKRPSSHPEKRPESPTPAMIESTSAPSSSSSSTISPPVIKALRLIKLSDRVSAVMRSHDTSTLLNSDPLLSIYRMFALFQGMNIYGEVDVVPEEDMAGCTLEKANGFGAEMIVIPWVIQNPSSATNVLPGDGWQTQAQTPKGNVGHNPFDALFKTAGVPPTSSDGQTHPTATTHHHSHGHGQGYWSLAPGTSLIHSHFIRNVFARSDVDVGLYIDQSGIISPTSHLDPTGIPSGAGMATNPLTLALNGSGNKGRGRVHIFLPFVGGPDDRLALEFVVGLCRKNERLRATVVRLKKVEGSVRSPSLVGADGTFPGAGSGDNEKTLEVRNEEINATTVASGTPGFPDTVYGQDNTVVRLQSETADQIIWARYATQPPIPTGDDSASLSSSEQTSIVPRMSFKEIATAKPLHAALDEAHALQRLSNSQRSGNTSHSSAGVGVVVITGRSRRLAVESHRAELKELIQEDYHVAGGGEAVEKSWMVREVRKTVGEVGSAFVGRGVGVGVWALQAALDREK